MKSKVVLPSFHLQHPQQQPAHPQQVPLAQAYSMPSAYSIPSALEGMLPSATSTAYMSAHPYAPMSTSSRAATSGYMTPMGSSSVPQMMQPPVGSFALPTNMPLPSSQTIQNPSSLMGIPMYQQQQYQQQQQQLRQLGTLPSVPTSLPSAYHHSVSAQQLPQQMLPGQRRSAQKVPNQP